MVQAKIRNLKTGAISDHRFRSVDMVERAILDETEMEYLYQDGDMYHFMNNETFEQIGLSDEVLGRRGPLPDPEHQARRSSSTRAARSASSCR